MRPALDDLSPVEHDYLVAVADRTEPVRDYKAGAAATPEVVVYDALRRRVKRAGGLVEDQQRRVADERPGYLQALALAPAEVAASLIDLALVAAGPRRYVVVDAGVLGGLHQLGVRARSCPRA